MPGEIAAWMVQLFAGGYMLLDRHDNENCMHCTEILLGKVLCEEHEATRRDAVAPSRAHREA